MFRQRASGQIRRFPNRRIMINSSSNVTNAEDVSVSKLVCLYANGGRFVIAFNQSSTFLLSDMTGKHAANFNRHMRFKLIACIQVGSILVGTTVGVVMA